MLRLSFLIVTSCLLTINTYIEAQEVFQPFTGKVLRSKVRLRAGPSLDGKIIQEVALGDFFVVTGEEDGFYAVIPPKGLRAYVYRTYVLDGVVEGNRINVRLEPDIESPVLVQLNSGDKVTGEISKQNNRWLRITPPETLRLYVATDYIEKVGNVDYLKTMEKRRAEVYGLLNDAYNESQEEMEKQDFAHIKLDPSHEKFQRVINDYQEFPDAVNRAKELVTLLQDHYLQRKIIYLEGRSQTISDAWQAKNSELAAEMKSQQEKYLDLQKHFEENNLDDSSEPLHFDRRQYHPSSSEASLQEHMALWIPIEKNLYEEWQEEHEDATIEVYYDHQLQNAVKLRGIIEAYDRPVKNKPGDYLLVNRYNRLPIAYLYSTRVNLQDYVGQEITLEAGLRPNNNFAYPSYFILETER